MRIKFEFKNDFFRSSFLKELEYLLTEGDLVRFSDWLLFCSEPDEILVERLDDDLVSIESRLECSFFSLVDFSDFLDSDLSRVELLSDFRDSDLSRLEFLSDFSVFDVLSLSCIMVLLSDFSVFADSDNPDLTTD